MLKMHSALNAADKLEFLFKLFNQLLLIRYLPGNDAKDSLDPDCPHPGEPRPGPDLPGERPLRPDGGCLLQVHGQRGRPDGSGKVGGGARVEGFHRV